MLEPDYLITLWRSSVCICNKTKKRGKPVCFNCYLLLKKSNHPFYQLGFDEDRQKALTDTDFIKEYSMAIEYLKGIINESS